MLEQLSIFDIEIPVTEDLKNNSIEKVNNDTQNSLFDIVNENSIRDTIITKYSGYTNRIVQLASNRFVLEYDDKLVYLDTKGNEDYIVANKLTILPIDKILYYSNDYLTNEVQNNLLRDYISKNRSNIDKVIKRIGDDNFIIITNTQDILSINNKGWLLEFKTTPVYGDNEILDINNFISDEEPVLSPIIKYKVVDGNYIQSGIDIVVDNDIVHNIATRETYNVNETVYVTYNGELYIGKVVSIYNNGDTANVVFDNMHTAFHINSLTKVE